MLDPSSVQDILLCSENQPREIEGGLWCQKLDTNEDRASAEEYDRLDAKSDTKNVKTDKVDAKNDKLDVHGKNTVYSLI